jgi:uncharacterized RDD family membrane protein YckC/cytoskeletal protein CcmA (bactofilin family)
MKTMTRKLIFILALNFLTGPASWATPADTAIANDQKPNDQTVQPTAPAPTEVLERTDNSAGAGSEPAPRELVLVGKDAVVREGETFSEVVVVGGSAMIDGTVTGDVVVIAGSAKVKGKINGGLVVVLGSADLGSDAYVRHNAVVVGGPVVTVPGAKIDGDLREVALGTGLSHFHPMDGWLGKGLFHARLLPPVRGWWWGMALVFLLLYLLVALIFQRPVQACVRALETRPVASIFSGILAFLLIGPLMLLLAVSGVGLVIVPFAICAILVVGLLGKVTVYQCTGLQLGRQTGLAALQQPLLALVLGAVLFCLLYTVPVLSFVVWGIIAPLGIGAVLIAFFGAFRKEGKTNGTTTPASTMAAIPTASFAPAAANPPMTSLATVATTTPDAGMGVPPVLPGSPSTPANPSGVGTSAQVPPPVAAGVPPMVGDTMFLPRVGFWLRLFAMALDFVPILLLTAFMHLSFRGFLVLWLVYHIGLWTWRGTTIGGVVTGIKIFRRDGRPISFGVAVVRSLASFFSFIVLGLGFFWAGWDREKQSWHDKIAGTIIVKMPKSISLL